MSSGTRRPSFLSLKHICKMGQQRTPRRGGDERRVCIKAPSGARLSCEHVLPRRPGQESSRQVGTRASCYLELGASPRASPLCRVTWECRLPLGGSTSVQSRKLTSHSCWEDKVGVRSFITYLPNTSCPRGTGDAVHREQAWTLPSWG